MITLFMTVQLPIREPWRAGPSRTLPNVFGGTCREEAIHAQTSRPGPVHMVCGWRDLQNGICNSMMPAAAGRWDNAAVISERLTKLETDRIAHDMEYLVIVVVVVVVLLLLLFGVPHRECHRSLAHNQVHSWWTQKQARQSFEHCECQRLRVISGVRERSHNVDPRMTSPGTAARRTVYSIQYRSSV